MSITAFCRTTFNHILSTVHISLTHLFFLVWMVSIFGVVQAMYIQLVIIFRYIIYKLPVNYSSPANKDWPFPPHLYTDSNNQTAQYLKQSLNDTNQALAYTLQQAYDNRRSPVSVLHAFISFFCLFSKTQ